MKKITTLLFSLSILSVFSFGQITPIQNLNTNTTSLGGNTYHSRRTHVNPKFCATDDFHNKRMATDSLYKYKHLESVNRFKNLPIQKNPTNGIYQVPVVVHVMHKGEAVGSGTNVSDADVKRGIQYLNNFWRKVIGSTGDGDGVDMQIEFTLAIQDESGNCTDGIDRVDMSGVSSYVNNGVNRDNTNGLDDYTSGGGINSLKEYSVWDQTEYYNVWIVDEIDNANCYSGGSYTAGYAYYASSHGAAWDGSVVLICSYLDENSDTWAHEMGHAFNLPHTFDGDNNGASCGDDGIFDTPQHPRTSSINPSIYFDCANTDANTCDPGFNEEINPDNGFIRNTGTHQDHMHNYMDYTGCSSEFTGGQRTVAHSAMTVERASFLTSPALTPPLPATVDFTSFAQVACLGSSIDFYDESTCTPNTYTNNGYAGISFLWTFDNGVNTPITSTNQNPTITFNNNGTYDVTLEITNPQGTTNLTKSGYITVTAGASAGCSASSTNNNNNFGCGVTNVSFNTLSNSTSTAIPSSAMQDFTCSNNTEVEVGNSYTLEITYNSRSDGAQELEVWIDWDNSGTFETTNSNGDNERVLTDNIAASAVGTPSTNVTPPANATLNTLLRMRVISDYTQTPTVCGNGFVQRADDYGVLVKSGCSNPDVPTISGTTTICNGDNTTLNIATGNLNDATDWQWYTTSCGGTSAGNGTSINVSPTTTTDYFVRGEGACVSGGSCTQITVTVNQAPTISSQPTNSTINENDNTTFSVTANNATGYQWQENSGSGFGNIINGGVYSGATSATLTITNAPLGMDGNDYRCIISGVCTPNATTNNASLTVNAATCNNPDSPTISGTTTICNGDNTALNITTGNLNDAIDWQWYTSSCGGTSAGNGTSINISPTTTTTYYVRGEGGCVTPSSCVQVTVTVNDIPANAGAITGSNSECENAIGISYSITAVSGATNYTWTVPSGATIASGQGSTNITVNFGTNSGNISVTPSNSCGNGGISNKTVTLNTCAGAPVANFSGSPTTVCEGNNVSFTDLSTNTPTSWNWSFPGGTPSTSTAQNPSITYNSAGTYNVTLTATNASGNNVKTKTNYITINSVTGSTLDSTQVRVQDCGITLNSASQVIYADPVVGATYYQFKVTNSSLGFSYETNWWQVARWIKMMDIPGIQTNTTYNVQARLRTGACDNSNYGSVCQITTTGNPVVNTQLINSLCGSTLNNINTAIYAKPVAGATDYTFEISNTSLVFNRTITIGWRHINLKWWGNQIQPNTTYDIKVKATVNGVVGNYSTVCQVTTPSSFRLGEPYTDEEIKNLVENETPLNLIIYPNPNQGEFVYLDLDGVDDNSEVFIMDVSGKIIQQQTIDSNKNTIRFNNKLKAGFYFITVVSENDKITKKLIVR